MPLTAALSEGLFRTQASRSQKWTREGTLLKRASKEGPDEAHAGTLGTWNGDLKQNRNSRASASLCGLSGSVRDSSFHSRGA